jgi:hypothetical protein
MDTLLQITIPEMNIPSEHVLIISAHCAILTFLEAQWESLTTFVQVPFTFIVFNDARPERPDRSDAIEKYCKDNHIIHIRIPQFMHDQRIVLFPDTCNQDPNNPSCRTATGLQIMMEIFKLHAGYAMVLDSDASLINTFSPTMILPREGPYTYLAVDQFGIGKTRPYRYIWNAFILFDMTRFPHREWMNMDCGYVDDVLVDTGGLWDTYFEKTHYTSLPKPTPDESSSCDGITHFKNDNRDMCFGTAEFYAGCVFHAHNGGSWNSEFDEEKQIQRATIFKHFIQDRIHVYRSNK